MMRPAFQRTFKGLLLAALVSVFLLVVAGNAARAAGAGAACPDWPTCTGGWLPPEDGLARLQWAHRALAAFSSVLVAATAAWAWRRYRAWAGLTGALAASAALMLAQIGVGAWRALAPGGVGQSMLHLALSLAALALLTGATAVVWSGASERAWGLRSRYARWALATTALLALVTLSGAWVTASGSGPACAGWPLCAGGLPQTPEAGAAFGHRLATLAAAVMAAAQFVWAWRAQRSRGLVLSAATAVGVLLVGQVLLGALKTARGFPTDLVGLHAAVTAGLWAAQAALVTGLGLANRSTAEEEAEAREPLPLKRRLKDFYLLSKPIIVALLLVTTYAGMVVGGKQLPGWQLTFWTMLGGALAAGGASALNQYIDRDLDRAMQRTARRPLPDGRLKPAEALAYGLGACLASFFLLAGYVNLLAAVLSLAGMVYYVLLYSVWLKHATVQNIVIGGGAGAIPPLVGWAAASGSLNIPALFLFAIVFLWTPPHFWALALVRRNDYARGGVPMLPVVRGEKETRWQIFVYTIELVALTLLMPALRLTGAVFLVSALALGGWLLHTAWRVLRGDGNKTAWLMYRYSSMYLAFIFLALVIDVLIP